MKPRIDLRYNDGRQWARSGRVWAKGFADCAGTIHAGENLARYFDSLGESLSNELPRLYGEFAVVIDHEDDSCTGAVDRVRSIPLFYGVSDGKAIVSDDAAVVASTVGTQMPDNVVKLSFLLQGTTLGRETLLPNVHQIRAGESISLTTRSASPVAYFDFGDRSDELAETRAEDLIDMGAAAVENAFSRLLRSSEGPFVVPLSGGLDSRLVVAMLHRAGRHDTVCYSYGGRDSFDTTISRRIAQILGLRWEFVPYSHAAWSRCAASDDFRAYRRRAAQFCAIEHEQDWPAVKALRSTGAVSEMSVFVPGHSGDFLAGSHLPRAAFGDGAPDAAAWIFRKYLNLWPIRGQDRELVRDLRSAVVNTLPPAKTAAQQFDEYGWRHRQSMMIVNSVRCYEDHGFDWRVPLWDAAMMSFWSSVPLPYRNRRRLYFDVVRSLVGKLSEIPFVAPPRAPTARLRDSVSDGGMHRFGIFAGRFPMSRLKPIAALTRSADPVIRAGIKPWRYCPVVRARINGLLSLERLEASLQIVPDVSEAHRAEG